MSYTSDFRRMLHHIEGSTKLTREEFYDIVYKTFGGLDQLDRLKKREETLKNNFNLEIEDIPVEVEYMKTVGYEDKVIIDKKGKKAIKKKPIKELAVKTVTKHKAVITQKEELIDRPTMNKLKTIFYGVEDDDEE